MPSRPLIQARDSAGRRVSLLNEEPAPSMPKSTLPIRTPEYPSSYRLSSMARSNSRDSVPSNMSSPLTPGLTRADSFDSNLDPISPLTPTFTSEYGRQKSLLASSYQDPTPYEYSHREYPTPSMYGTPARSQYTKAQSPSYPESNTYEEDEYSRSNPDRGGKRYPCRFRESHSCSKTFTTSGHASRHSKIHTAEKGVHCTYEGCPKKFTRADNMKQHLETHSKDKSRSKMVIALTRPAGVRKASGASISRPSSRNASCAELSPVDPALIAHGDPSRFHKDFALASPTYGAPPSTSLPMTSTYQGLDVLAAAADFTAHP